MMRRDGLARRILLTSVLVALFPSAIIWAMGPLDAWIASVVEGDLERAGEILAQASGDFAKLDALAREHRVFARVVDREGRVLHSTSPLHGEGRFSEDAWSSALADFFFGPEGAPDLFAYERGLAAIEDRHEIQSAFDGERESVVRAPEFAKMFVFYRAVPTSDGDGVLYLSRMSRRNVRALYDLRYAMLKLTLVVVLVSAVVASCVGRRIERLTMLLHRRLENTANLAADFAHDLKSPLSAAMIAAELLEDAALDRDERARAGAALGDATQHMKRSVDSLLCLARLDNSLESEVKTKVAIGDLVSRVVEEYQRQPGQKHAIVAEPKTNAVVLVIEARLTQAIRNLIDNALGFSRSKVVVRVERSSETIVISVTDDGPGVSPGHRDKVFSRFFSARSAGESSGLGLSIVRSIAEAHRGHADLGESSALGGACFRIVLPT